MNCLRVMSVVNAEFVKQKNFTKWKKFFEVVNIVLAACSCPCALPAFCIVTIRSITTCAKWICN